MQAPQPYTARLEEKVVHNDKYIQYQFELVSPHEIEFAAGQYVSIQVSPQGHRRSYSICSSPAVKHGFEILNDITPWGIGSQFLESLHFGDTVLLLGPLGTFTLVPPPAEAAVVLIGTGSGVTPLKAMLDQLLQLDRDQRPITLLWGMRFAKHLFWLDDFEDLADAFPNFRFMPVISRPTPDWTLSRGRVTDVLRLTELPDNAGYYLCGNEPMVKETVEILNQRGAQPAYIHHEKFY